MILLLFIVFMFFSTPIILTIYFAVSIILFVVAKRKSRLAPNAFSPALIKRRKIHLIISGILSAVSVFSVVGLILAVVFGAIPLM